jgi:hypothetical protein
MNARELKPKGREDARPDHVGDNQNGGGKKAYRLFSNGHWAAFILSFGLFRD